MEAARESSSFVMKKRRRCTCGFEYRFFFVSSLCLLCVFFVSFCLFFIIGVGLCLEVGEVVVAAVVGMAVSGLTARVCICRRAASYGCFYLSLSWDESDRLSCVAWFSLGAIRDVGLSNSIFGMSLSKIELAADLSMDVQHGGSN